MGEIRDLHLAAVSGKVGKPDYVTHVTCAELLAWSNQLVVKETEVKQLNMRVRELERALRRAGFRFNEILQTAPSHYLTKYGDRIWDWRNDCYVVADKSTFAGEEQTDTAGTGAYPGPDNSEGWINAGTQSTKTAGGEQGEGER